MAGLPCKHHKEKVFIFSNQINVSHIKIARAVYNFNKISSRNVDSPTSGKNFTRFSSVSSCGVRSEGDFFFNKYLPLPKGLEFLRHQETFKQKKTQDFFLLACEYFRANVEKFLRIDSSVVRNRCENFPSRGNY